MFKRVLTGALVAATLIGSAGSASAADWRGGWRGGYRGGHYGGAGAVIGAGVLGLAVGAAIAGADRHPVYEYGNPYYYGPPPVAYEGPAYYAYDGGCRVYWRWDAYWRRYVQVQRCY